MLLIVAALDRDDARASCTARRARSTSTCSSRSTTRRSSSARWSVDADVIGINNRDLDDFSVDLERTFDLLSDVPGGQDRRLGVGLLTPASSSRSSSGSASTRCSWASALMRAADPEEALRELHAAPSRGDEASERAAFSTLRRVQRP